MRRRLLISLVVLVVCLAVPATALASKVSPPIPNSTRYELDTVIKFKNYVTPRLENPGSREMWYYIDRKTSSGRWLFYDRVLGDWDYSDYYRYRTPVTGRTRAYESGSYRVFAKMIWYNEYGRLLTWRSAYRYYSVGGTLRRGATFVSKPQTARSVYTDGDSVRIASYVRPKFSSLSGKRLYYYIDWMDPDGDWIFQGRVRATLYRSSSYKLSTLARARYEFWGPGRWRMMTKFMWYDEDGDLHVQKSGYHYICVRE